MYIINTNYEWAKNLANRTKGELQNLEKNAPPRDWHEIMHYMHKINQKRTATLALRQFK